MRQRVQRHADRAQHRFETSSAGDLWQRLTSFDFITQAMIFAAVLLLCFFPFVIVLDALLGRNTTTAFTRFLGLNHQAATDMHHLFTSDQATSSAVTGTSYIFFIVGGYAAATALQSLYERSFNLESRGMRDVLRRILWLALAIGATILGGWAAGPIRDAGDLPYALSSVVGNSAFFWFTMWFLLSGRVRWRYLLPGAIATGLFWMGMLVVFRHVFSGEVISDYNKYGTIGAIFALMSFFIAIGVVVVLGAMTGIVWRERGLSWSGAFRRLRRGPSSIESDDGHAPEH
jgi:membrane protein